MSITQECFDVSKTLSAGLEKQWKVEQQVKKSFKEGEDLPELCHQVLIQR